MARRIPWDHVHENVKKAATAESPLVELTFEEYMGNKERFPLEKIFFDNGGRITVICDSEEQAEDVIRFFEK